MSTEGVGDMFSFSLTSSGNAGYVRLAPERNLQIRDVVLIMGENVPRKNWPMGRVIQASPGKDGLVTTAQVRRRWSVFSRPAAKLCLFEALGDSM